MDTPNDGEPWYAASLFLYSIILATPCFLCTFSSDLTPSPQSEAADTPGAPVKKRKMVVRDDFEEAMLQHLKERTEERKNRKQDTDDDHFGRHVTSVLKRLPNRAKAVARLRIEQVLLDAEFPEPHAPPHVHYPSNYQ